METKYITLEIQHFADGNVAVLPTKHDTRNDAEAKFYTLCAAGCHTELPLYTVMVMTTEGFVLDHKVFKNEVQPEPEPTQVEEPEQIEEPIAE